MSLIRLNRSGYEMIDVFKLTRTERLVIEIFLNCKNQAEMAAKLFVTEKAIKYHMGNIYRRLRVEANAVGLWRWLVTSDLIEVILEEPTTNSLKIHAPTRSETPNQDLPVGSVLVTRLK